jgi:hypothetical protein
MPVSARLRHYKGALQDSIRGLVAVVQRVAVCCAAVRNIGQGSERHAFALLDLRHS